ncbi:DM13 domain-containing protein [Streptomyces sp. TLI_105]|uniref:DM13 domain-containing protein n=1 Tax=Streptomyces sp. TLI_105 TaxID=1881019 RepID=UPI00089AE4A0|nr:DM13 domain-containing protein [Streptomyces sp. TLI_105]SEE08303.1 Electron transfer DM13 [Streptomyces sp. TLI_105]
MGRVTRKQRWGAVVVAVLAVAGLSWFKPWALWVDETVNEALPSASATPNRPATGEPSSASATPAPPGPVTVAQGSFVSHEHATTGTVKIVRLADGTHTLRLEGLDTSNGPDLRVWLSDAPVEEGKDGWGVFDDGKYVDLAKLKGNKGDQNYPLPADVDWSTYPSVSIWCDRFDVSFGAAALVRT